VSGWHALAWTAVVEASTTDARAGLRQPAAAARRREHGDNRLPTAPRPSPLAVLLRQFRSPLVYLLLGAALVAVALGHQSDGAVIAAVVMTNALLGAVQEGRAERALRSLRRAAPQHAHVVRDGRALTIDAAEVVPGDLLLLTAGDAVVADARLIEAEGLATAEAALTGESTPVDKRVDPVAADAPLAERASMVHAGTHAVAGRGRAVVVATGASTELGRVVALAEAAAPPPTPLERQIARFGRHVLVAAGALFAAIVLIGLVRGVPAGQLLMLGISQIVGVIPEGLPVAVTIALATGVRRMARRRAIVRRLSAVEALGATTVICTDKTGTLTRNEMTVTRVVLPGRAPLEVEGVGYQPDGRVLAGGAPVPASDPALAALLEAAALCNDAALEPPGTHGPSWRVIGDPTEAALITLARKAGLEPAELAARQPRIAELPFDPAARLMATAHRDGATARVYLKGALESVLALCDAAGVERAPLDAVARAEILAAGEAMAGAALRVLAIARIDGAAIDPEGGFAALPARASFLGLVGQLDPPRLEAAAAVDRCRSAGIRTVMVTGDHRSTALAIARRVGIAGEDDLAIDAAELARLSDAELDARLARVRVFSRVQPDQKLRIVAAYQRAGEVVAMTGDGVNDAPALVRSDVGVAMGRTGTEAAKEAAKIVITDDDFATIVAAVEEGRVVKNNLEKALVFLVTTSLAEVGVLVAAILFGLPPPFAAVQILWNNLVTEGVITINLILDPAEGGELGAAPRPRGEPLITRAMRRRIWFLTPAIAAVALGWYAVRLRSGVPIATAQTETFTLLVVCEWFNVLNCRSATRSAFARDLLRNRWLLGGLAVGNLLQVAIIFSPAMNRLFHTTPFDLGQVVAIGAAGSLVLAVEEARKWWVRRRAG
jgi:Ca2+-transporting ATPase